MTSFFNRLWDFRLVRWGTWTLATLITLDALVCGYINWSGARRWAATQAMLQSNGETLDFNKLLPHPVHDALNFCAIEPLLGINAPGDEKSPFGRKRAVLEKAGWQTANGTLKSPVLLDGPSRGARPDLHAWAAFLAEAKYLSLPASSPTEAHDLLAAMDASYPVLKQLAEAAAARQEAVFVPVPVPARPLFAMALPHYTAIRKASLGLTLRALAANESGDTAVACDSAQAVLRLAHAAHQEPFLIAQLMAGALNDLAVESVWAILEKRQATEPQLQALQRSLERLDFHQGTLLAVRGELAAAIDSLECVQAGSYRMSDLTSQITPAREGPASPQPLLARLFWGLLPFGLIDHNKAVIGSMDYEYCIAPLKRAGTFDLGASLNDDLNRHRGWSHPDHVMANLLVPAMSKVFERMCRMEAIRGQAVAACVLERYFLIHHAYPNQLADLLAVPGLLKAVPLDPVDGQPLRYRQTAEGRYLLWSVGFDRKDDQGRVAVSPGKTPATTRLYDRDYQGDWAWQYQPVK